MLDRVYKYELPINEAAFSVSLPRLASVLHVAVQHDRPCLWISCDPEQPKTPHGLYWVGTGHERPADACKHLGTVLLQDGDLVLHLFARAAS